MNPSRMPSLRLLALAASCALLAAPSPSAWAGATPSGTVFARNAGTFVGGLGDFLLPGDELWVGLNTPGDLLLDGGSLLRVGMLSLAQNGGRTVPADGVSKAVITGAGTRVQLDGNGNRLGVGEWGTASLTISEGATVDGRYNAAECLNGLKWCHVFIGNAAGSDGTLTITGAGSSASFLRSFVVGNASVFSPPLAGFTFGTPGGTTHGRVNVLAGGLLTTDGGELAVGPGGGSALGTERSFAAVVVDGVGSTWRVTGGTLDGGGATINLASHANATATLDVTGGGLLQIQGKTGVSSAVNIGNQGGKADMVVRGVGSQLQFTGDAGILKIGRNNSTATLVVDQGAQASGMYYLNVGRDGGHGELTVDGAGSRILVNGTSTAAANGGTANNPVMDIGRNGTGVVTVSSGGRIELVSTAAQPLGSAINLGRDAASSGTLNIVGAGSAVTVSAASTLAGGGPAEALNPGVRVGREGMGVLNISNGGLLWLDGHAVSTVADSRSTLLIVGGLNDTTAGGHGIATVSGAGSEIRLTGIDTYIGVGHGPQSFGSLTVADQAKVSAIGINVGRSGGVGELNVDHATLSFSGQQTGNTLSGAFLSIGRAGGTGTATITNGSEVTLVNPGSAGATVGLGGTATGPGGNGSLTLSGGSHISIQAAFGRGALTVGHDGTGLMRIQGGSSVDVSNSGAVFVGRVAGSDGTLLISEGSSVTAGWVGVGRSKAGAGQPDVDGGTGVLIVNGSTVTAPNLVIGSHGYLGGTGTLVGHVTNFGTFNPGNSPGQMRIDGGFTAEAGSKLVLEVQALQGGGYATDSLVFGAGSTLDFSHLAVEFRFLGATDPNAFQASGGFKVDTFFQTSAGQALDHQTFAGASFSAHADAYQFTSFSFNADGGAVFTAAAVPEPGAGWMALAGLAVLAGVARRRR